MNEDLINRQAAIDAIENTDCELLPSVWDELTDAIMQVPTAEPRWIPVTERLPEEEDYHDFWEFPDGAVLWCKDTGEIGIGWYYKLSNNWGDLWDNAVRDIVAWMPLPEPYKRSGDENNNQI